jgi:uncharacterized membrane protein
MLYFDLAIFINNSLFPIYNMKKIISHFKDRFIKGFVFLLPLLVLFVLLGKALYYTKGFSIKIAKLMGVPKTMEVGAHTIVSAVTIIIVCVLLGYLVHFTFMVNIRSWMDNKLADLLPGYASYRGKALSKINKEEEKLPYEKAVLVRENNYHYPGFLMDELPDGRLTLFIPFGGNAKEGRIIIISKAEVTILDNADVKQVHNAIQNMGTGLGQVLT